MKNQKTVWKTLGMVGIIFVIGVIFRMWFISLAPQPFGWDQYEYEIYAKKMLDQGLVASHSYRSYPYPFFLSLLYLFVGFGNHMAVFFAQAILDSLIGIMIFVIMRNALRLRREAWIGFILYICNPFTSGYVGVLLAEILSAFFIAATILSGMFFIKRPTIAMGFLFGLCAGMAAETRNAAFFWAIIPIVFALFFVSFRKHFKKYIVIILAFGLSILYPLYTNWREYREINITTVDSFYAKEFFQGVLLKKLPPFTYLYPIESHLMWQEYYSEYDPGRTTEQRRAMAKKYYDKGWALIMVDPWDYIKTRFYKMWYVWQKENVFFYEEPGFTSHWMITYLFNLILLALTVFGLIGFWPFVKNNISGKWVLITIMGTMVYGTLAFSLTHAEYRLTIPFYPLLFVSSAMGIRLIVGIIGDKKDKRSIRNRP